MSLLKQTRKQIVDCFRKEEDFEVCRVIFVSNNAKKSEKCSSCFPTVVHLRISAESS